MTTAYSKQDSVDQEWCKGWKSFLCGVRAMENAVEKG
jgi:hypothetical protein